MEMNIISSRFSVYMNTERSSTLKPKTLRALSLVKRGAVNVYQINKAKLKILFRKSNL